MIGLLSVKDDHFFAVEDVAISRFSCGRLAVMKCKATLTLYVGKRTQHVSGNDAGQPVSLLSLVARAAPAVPRARDGMA